MNDNDGMYMDGGEKLQKIGILLTHNSLVTPLKEVAIVLVFDIEIKSVAKLEVLH